MKIVGVGGEKGGCGKTTVATNIAAAGAAEGLTVGLIDADGIKPDAQRWNERRRQLAILPQLKCKRVLGEIDDAIIALANEVDLLVIDTGGMDSPEIRYAAGYSHIFLAPFNPSRYDLDTAQKVSSIIALARPNNPGLKSYSLLVSVSNHPLSRSTIKARASLDSVPYLPCLKATIHSLEVWKETADSGRGVVELPSTKAQSDLAAVVKEIGLW